MCLGPERRQEGDQEIRIQGKKLVLSDLCAGGRAGVMATRMVSDRSHQHVGYALSLVLVACPIVREAFVDVSGEQAHKSRSADQKGQVISRLPPKLHIHTTFKG